MVVLGVLGTAFVVMVGLMMVVRYFTDPPEPPREWALAWKDAAKVYRDESRRITAGVLEIIYQRAYLEQEVQRLTALLAIKNEALAAHGNEVMTVWGRSAISDNHRARCVFCKALEAK